jgi:ketosteroid isomerase-like protein
MTNVELVKQGYLDFASGNIEAVLATWDPGMEWHECKGMPFVEGDGIYIGPESILTNVLMKLPVFFDGFSIEVNELFGAGDKVVMVGYYTGTNKATGKPFKANAIHVWTVKDGKGIRYIHAVDTATILS